MSADKENIERVSKLLGCHTLKCLSLKLTPHRQESNLTPPFTLRPGQRASLYMDAAIEANLCLHAVSCCSAD